MKDLLCVLFLILVIFSLVLCYGLGMYCMYKAGWHKSFYFSVSTVVGLFALIFLTNRLIKSNVNDKK